MSVYIAVNRTPISQLRDVTCHGITRCYLLRDTSIGLTAVQKVGGGTKRGPKGRSSKPEGLRAEVGFFGRGQRAPKKIGCWCLLGLNFAVFHLLSGQNLGRTNNIGVPRTVISGGTRPPRPPVVYAYAVLGMI